MLSADHNPDRTTLTELIGMSRHARTLQLRSIRIGSRLTGNYLSRIKGRGMEFDESRVYQPGDDVRNIDWRVTARTGAAHTKMFREERERPVFISMDDRSTMRFATQGRFKSVIAAELTALLAWTASQQGDRVGGEIFNDIEHREFRPRRGKENVLHMLRTLSQSSDQVPVAPGSLQAAFNRLHRIVHPGSLVCVISDFHGFDAGAQKEIVNVSRHSEVLLLHAYDRLESDLPQAGRYRLSLGGRSLDINTADDAYRIAYRQQFQQRTNALSRVCGGGRMKKIVCRTDESPVVVLRNVLGKQRVHSSRAG